MDDNSSKDDGEEASDDGGNNEVDFDGMDVMIQTIKILNTRDKDTKRASRINVDPYNNQNQFLSCSNN